MEHIFFVIIVNGGGWGGGDWLTVQDTRRPGKYLLLSGFVQTFQNVTDSFTGEFPPPLHFDIQTATYIENSLNWRTCIG